MNDDDRTQSGDGELGEMHFWVKCITYTSCSHHAHRTLSPSQLELQQPIKKRKFKKKQAKIPGLKRPSSSFMLYSIERRPHLKKEKPDLKFGEYGKIIGQEWRAMSEKEKEPYVTQANKDKAYYLKKKAEMGF